MNGDHVKGIDGEDGYLFARLNVCLQVAVVGSSRTFSDVGHLGVVHNRSETKL
jgi:hypothetical protein